ncbi:hypothetical protein SLEP1_g53194 [Rubroshorea leprosula]|uniref:Uncharacterized protein n=1 Tax=Rubroshorea leprosula TaxID=152421 RepID=A0AAV5MC79_9ROSI|nr:hypothetical protein SLEP1_g53194 [Rubroshorea leprosula]
MEEREKPFEVKSKLNLLIGYLQERTMQGSINKATKCNPPCGTKVLSVNVMVSDMVVCSR